MVVPYTYAVPYQTYVWAPVQTFSGVQAQTFGGISGFGAAPFAGASFGAAPFAGVSGFGAAPFAGAPSFGSVPLAGPAFGGLQLTAGPQTGGDAAVQLLQLLRALQAENGKVGPSAGGACSGAKPSAGDTAVTLDVLTARITEVKTQLAQLGTSTEAALTKHEKRIAELEARIVELRTKLHTAGNHELDITLLKADVELLKSLPTAKKEFDSLPKLPMPPMLPMAPQPKTGEK